MVTLTELFSKDVTSSDYTPISGMLMLDLIDFIKENCKPYLLNKPPKKWLQKGSSLNQNQLYKIENIHSQRRPKDLSITVHNFLEQVISLSGASVNRSNCRFAVANEELGTGQPIDEYGIPCYVFPIGNFDITWSKLLADPFWVFTYHDYDGNLEIFKDNKMNIEFVEGKLSFEFPIDDKIHNRKIIEKLIKSYQHGLQTLPTAMKTKNEIMIGGCEKILVIQQRDIGEKIVKYLQRSK